MAANQSSTTPTHQPDSPNPTTQAPATLNPSPVNQTRQPRFKPGNPAHPKLIPASRTRRPIPNNPRFKPDKPDPTPGPNPAIPDPSPNPNPAGTNPNPANQNPANPDSNPNPAIRHIPQTDPGKSNQTAKSQHHRIQTQQTKPGRHESEPKPKADGPRSYIPIRQPQDAVTTPQSP